MRTTTAKLSCTLEAVSAPIDVTTVGDELADAIVYTGMRAVMRAVAKRRRVEAFRHDEAYRAVEEAMAPMVEVGK